MKYLHKVIWKFQNIKIDEFDTMDNTIIFGNFSISWQDAKDKIDYKQFTSADSYEITFKNKTGIQETDPSITIGQYTIEYNLIENTDSCLVNCHLDFQKS